MPNNKCRSRTNKKYKRKTRKGGSKQFKGGILKNLNEKFNGLNFFRKYGGNSIEHRIGKILQNNPHPNIVKVYNITEAYIDIEEVATGIEYNEKELVAAANSAKAHLQSLGIMYIDWKPDNMGLGVDGKYKLFDFDGSGMTSIDNKTWKFKPSEYWSYRQAVANGITDPKEIDDFAFEINFTNKNYQPLNVN